MIPHKSDYTIGSLFQFSPFIIFLALYSFLYYYTLHTKNIYYSPAIILAGLPLFAAFITTIYAFFTYKESLNLNKKIEIFLSGASNIATIEYCFNIICITVLNHLLAKTNGILTAVTLGLILIPSLWVMPTLFLIASICSIIIGNLATAIIILMPICYGIAQSLQINSGFMAATIIGGALFGTHISLYFDLLEQKTFNIYEIFKNSFWFVIGAAISTLIVLSKYECLPLDPTVYNYLQNSLTIENCIPIIPYIILLIGSILRINILANLTICSCIALTTEIMFHKIIFLDSIATMFYGYYRDSMIVNIVLLHFIMTGLTKIIKYNNGFMYIIDTLKPKGNQSTIRVQASIIIITILANMLMIIETICLNLITQPIKRFANKYMISQKRVSDLLHTTTTTMFSVLPYASIMFITIHITHSSYFEIMSYMIYPFFITLATIISIFAL